MEVKQGKSAIGEKDQIIVDNFAKDTGDFHTLSVVDRQVIALGLSISRTKNEFSKVNIIPKSLEEFKPKGFKQFYTSDEEKEEKFWDDSSDAEEEQKTPKTDGLDDFQETKGGRHALKEREIKKYTKPEEKQEEKLIEQQEPSSSDEEKLDDEEEGGEWVTDENLHKHISGGTTQDLMA